MKDSVPTIITLIFLQGVKILYQSMAVLFFRYRNLQVLLSISDPVFLNISRVSSYLPASANSGGHIQCRNLSYVHIWMDTLWFC